MAESCEKLVGKGQVNSLARSQKLIVELSLYWYYECKEAASAVRLVREHTNFVIALWRLVDEIAWQLSNIGDYYDRTHRRWQATVFALGPVLGPL